MSHLLNGCFLVLNLATSSCLIQSCEVIYKTNTTFIRTFFFQATARLFVPAAKFSQSVLNYLTKKTLLLSSFHKARAVKMKKKIFCEGESVIKPYLKIVANLLHGGKHFADNVEQIGLPWSNNEHAM